MKDDWLRDIGNKNIISAVLIDLTAAFDIMDYEVLLKRQDCYGFSQSAF